MILPCDARHDRAVGRAGLTRHTWQAVAVRLRRSPTLSVVVPAYGVAPWLPACLESLVAQRLSRWEAIVVDDGSVDGSGEVAEEWAARDRRIRVVHIANRGLGGARNVGTGHARAPYLTFLDADDVLPPDAYATLVGTLERSGSDFATGSIVRAEADGLTEPGWMRRTHVAGTGLRIEERPEILGDVFAWNKVWRRSFWDDAGLAWPERVRYEDQPTTTRSFLLGRFDVRPEIVYHWRIRDDGSSITQQRHAVADLTDRWRTKQMALDEVRAHGSAEVERVFLDRVLPGDMWRYFALVPGCSDEWWALLRDGVRDIWGERSLLESGLTPVNRLVGWLVAQDRRADVEALLAWTASLPGRPPREPVPDGTGMRLAVPAAVLAPGSVPAAALQVRPAEV